MEIVLYSDGAYGPSEYICEKLRMKCMELEPCSGYSCGFCFSRNDADLIAFTKQAIMNGDKSAAIVKVPDNTTDFIINRHEDADDLESLTYVVDGKLKFIYGWQLFGTE